MLNLTFLTWWPDNVKSQCIIFLSEGRKMPLLCGALTIRLCKNQEP